MSKRKSGGYGADDSLLDYILGITHEIWEQGQVNLIAEYYCDETIVYAMDGITHGSTAMIDGTRGMLRAFPDRLLLADDVIGSGDVHSGYSSHRVLSPMTNRGDSTFAPATGKSVRIMNMADCVVREGVIIKEWLARDNLALVRQLGCDVLDSARQVKDRHTNDLRAWISDETERLRENPTGDAALVAGIDMRELLHACWISGDSAVIGAGYAEYAVLHRSPVEFHSGRSRVAQHYADLRHAFQMSAVCIDNFIANPADAVTTNVAIRWSAIGAHVGDFHGVSATGRSVYLMGVTHRRLVGNRIAVEWTVFDSLGALSQLV